MALLKLYAIEDRWEDAYPVIWIAYDRASGSDERLNWLTMRMRAELERISHKESITHLRRYVAADADDLEALRALARAELALGQSAERRAPFPGLSQEAAGLCSRLARLSQLLLEQGELERFLAAAGRRRRRRPTATRKPGTSAASPARKPEIGAWRPSHFRKAIELNPFLAKMLLPARHGRRAAGPSRAGRRPPQEIDGNERGTWSVPGRLLSLFRRARVQRSRGCSNGDSGPAPRRDLRDAGLGPGRSSVEPGGGRP